MIKQLFQAQKHFLFYIILFYVFNDSLFSQATYYWVHNDPITTATENSVDQVNATNTGTGTAYWKHFSTVSGSSITANLVPASTNITPNDIIIIDNNSVPSRTITTTYYIVVNHNGLGLQCLDFNASSWSPPVGQLQRLRINITTNLEVYRHFRLSPSNRFDYCNGNLSFPNNLATTVDSVRLYGTAQGGGSTFRYTTLTINAKTNGKVFFCDTVNNRSGIILANANDGIGSTNEVHFLENIFYQASDIQARAGQIFIHKNIENIGALRVGMDLAGGNFASSNSVYSKLTLHASGFYSSPGLWNTGLWSDPIYSTRNENVIKGLNTDRCFIGLYRGLLDAQNTRVENSDLYFYNTRSVASTQAIIGDAGVILLTNINTYFRFNSTVFTYRNVYTGYKLRGTYNFQKRLNTNSNLYSAPNFNSDTIIDTLLVNVDIAYSAFRLQIDPTGYARFFPGNIYNMGCNDYNNPGGTFWNKGILKVGTVSGCTNDSLTKLVNFNLIMLGTATQTINNTQFNSSRIQGTIAQRAINNDNTDMGGNMGLIFNLISGQQTMYGLAPLTAGYSYGTAPYNKVPFTGRVARTLIWDNTISGATYWSEHKWADDAISSSMFDQCPPTFIDSVIVKPGTLLRIDQRATQCKTLQYLPGATSTLSQRSAPLIGATLSDSLSTLEVFGSLLFQQKINNQLNRNIILKAWQTYPQVLTNGTTFWRGFMFQSINTGTNNPISEINPGTWTLQDSLRIYNQNITFSPRANSSPECKLINFPAVTYALYDLVNNFSAPINTYVTNLVFVSGNLYTNNKNIHTYSFYNLPNSKFNKNLYLGQSTIHLYDGLEHWNYANSTNTPYAYNQYVWYAADNGGKFKIFPGTSHIKIHCKSFMQSNDWAGTTNKISTSSFTAKGLNYYDVSFLQNDTTVGIPYASTFGSSIKQTIAGIHISVNCNYHNITFWNSDGRVGQFKTWRDTVNKVIFKYNAGTNNSSGIYSIPSSNNLYTPTSNQINSSIDSLIFETKQNTISDGIYNFNKYISFSGGSTNVLQPGARHRIYNPTLTILTRRPWEDKTPAVPPFAPTYTAPTAYSTYVWGPTGAKLRARTTCDKPIIIQFGGFANAGNSIGYPTPYHWSGAAPRDTFDVNNLTVIDDSLNQLQTVNPNTILSGSTLNWDVPIGTPRTLVFRGSGVAGASWFDNTKWAQITYPGGIKTISSVGQCPPVCGDSVYFDNSSFALPTHSCDIGSGNTAYCGTMIWNAGVKGILNGGSNSILNICNSFYAAPSTASVPTWTNNFMGQIVFSGVTPGITEKILSGKIVFNSQLLFNGRNPVTSSWVLLDSIACTSYSTSIYPSVKIKAGNIDTRGKNLNLLAGLDLNSTLNRSLTLRSSTLTLSGGNYTQLNSGNGYAFNIDGDYTKLILKADSSDIRVSNKSAATGGGNFRADFMVWNGFGTSQFFTSTPKGFRFNRITLNGLISNNNYLNVNLRADTINELTIINSATWQYAYKCYIRKCNLIVNTVVSPQIIGNTATLGNLGRFNGNRIDTLRITEKGSLPASFYWDTLLVKDEFVINAGSNINFAKGGLTFLSNTCNAQIVGTSALPIGLNTNVSIGKSFNYPSGIRIQNEHYIRKDSGTVCTNYAQLYNIWAIGNGNGNNSCSGGSAWGCTAGSGGTANGVPYGNWYTPALTNTTLVNVLSDTTLFSSETPVFQSAGRARFLAGSNAIFGWPDPTGTRNNAGWDPAPSPTFPPTSLALSQTTICANGIVTASLTLLGTPTAKDFPITATYSLGTTQYAYTYTSTASNPYTFTFSPTPTTNSVVTWVSMSNVQCFNSKQTVNTTQTLSIKPVPVITASSSIASNTTICSGVSTTLVASGASSYTWSTSQTTSTIAVIPSVTTTYSVVGANSVALGGCKSVTQLVTINVNPTPTVAVAISNPTLCLGNTTTLTASGANTYTWVTPTSTQTAIVVNPSSTTVYSVTGTNLTGNCKGAVKQVTVNVYPNPTITSSYSPAVISPGDSFTVSASGAVSYSWSPNGLTVPSFTTTNNITYTVTGTNSFGCSTSQVLNASTIGFLPIELVDFKAYCEGKLIYLNWTTATELNNNYFELQRSTNGINYEKVAIIQANGTSTIMHNYEYVDNNPSYEYVYYRLVQTDFDLTKTMSQSIVVNCQGNVMNDAVIYPNPTDNNNLNIVYSVNEDEVITVKIIDVLGQCVISETITLAANKTMNSLKINNLAAGSYLVQLNSKQLTNNSIKFIKQ